MFADFQDLIALLNKHKAKYLVIGGYAVSRHAQPRYTKDLDIFVLPAPHNAMAVFRALAEFGAPLHTRTAPHAEPTTPMRTLTAKDFEDSGTWYTMGVPPVAVDILPEIPGVTFDAAWKNRSTQIIDEASGLTAHFSLTRGSHRRKARSRPRPGPCGRQSSVNGRCRWSCGQIQVGHFAQSRQCP